MWVSFFPIWLMITERSSSGLGFLSRSAKHEVVASQLRPTYINTIKLLVPFLIASTASNHCTPDIDTSFEVWREVSSTLVETVLLIVVRPTDMAARNIVFFGESGHGKSSVINLILGENKAPISSRAIGCTPQCIPYPHQIQGHDFLLWDTCGLNESPIGRVPDLDALKKLYSLLKGFENGVSLLVFCIRGQRINDTAKHNWQLFRNIICQEEVPTVIAITGLEDEDPMDNWWEENKDMFSKHGIIPFDKHGSGVACITASKGKLKDERYRYQDEYDESRTKVCDLIVQNSLREPWKVDQVMWIKKIVDVSWKTEWCRTEEIRNERVEKGQGFWELLIRLRMSEQDALKVAEELQDM